MVDETWDDETDGIHSNDTLRRMWRPQYEVTVPHEARVAWSATPVGVVVSRFLEADERREVVIRAKVGEEAPAEVVYVYAHALESERGVAALVRVLEGKTWLASRDAAWALVRACEEALHVEREAWLEAHARDKREAKAFLAERSQRFAALAAAEPVRQLGAGRKK